MPTPLLLTKLSVPQLRAQRVNRPKLVDQLNTGLSGKLTLVCAPAGYGKTTLVMEWLSRLSEEYTPGWFTLDDGDNDPVRFLAYIIAAIQKSFPDFGVKTSALLHAPQQPPDEVILTSLLNEMAEIPTPCILILDDYHAIHTPRIHQNLAILLEHQPNNMHLVVISREDPLLPIARLRARGYLNEIRQDDLRFTHQECADLFQNVIRITIPIEDLSALERRTEGWIAGLHLAAISMQHDDEPSRFIEAFTGSSRYILDFLIDEVFDRQPEDMQKFLMLTSILERLSGPLCDAVLGQSNSQEFLEHLEQINLFIIPLDHSRTWYRYHRLFSELLRYRLRRSESESQFDLHNRASQWFEANNFIPEAIHHAAAAQNWDRVAAIMTEVHTEMLSHGEAATLARWYGAIPREVLLSNHKLCFDYCWPLLLTGRFEEAAELLAHVEQMAQDIPPFLGEILTAQAYLARVQGDHALMVERSRRARALLPKESVASRGLVAINLGLAYWHMGLMEATEEVLPEAIEASQATGNHYGLITAIILQARVLAVRGQLRQAAEISRQAIEQGGQIPINALAHLDMSALHYEWNQLAESESYLMRAFDLSRRGQNAEFEVGCWMMLSRLRLAQGDLQAAREALAKGQEKIDSGTIPLLTASRFETAKLRLALAQDNVSAILKTKNRMADDVGSHNFCRFTNLAKAKLLLARNQRQQAADYLANLAQKARQNGWQYPLIAIRAYQTLAAENLDRAIHFLEEALILARPEGFIRTFVDLSVDFTPYLNEAARCGVEPSYVREILTAIQDELEDEMPVSSLVEPLSEREIEVLRLVVAGLSNREIAQDLIISLGTAKTHIHNIYGKSEVSNRAQAIARAREYELV